VQYLDPADLVAIRGRREAHAADRDRRWHHCKSNLSDRSTRRWPRVASNVRRYSPGGSSRRGVPAGPPAQTRRAGTPDRPPAELRMVAPKHTTAPGRLRPANPQGRGIGRILASPAFLSPRPIRPSPHQKLSCVRWRGLLLFESRLRDSDNRAGRLERALGLSELPVLVCRHYGEES